MTETRGSAAALADESDPLVIHIWLALLQGWNRRWA